MLRLGLLLLLWLVVMSTVAVLRRDIYGTRLVSRFGRKEAVRSNPPAQPSRASAPARQSRPAAPQQSAPPVQPSTPQPPSMLLPTKIIVIEGTLTGSSIALSERPVMIGRNPDSTLVLSDDYASGRHARIFKDGGSWFLEDLGSTNGTFIGSTKLTEPIQLQVGTRVRIGRSTVIEARR